MKEGLDSRYDHLVAEREAYSLWEKSGYFNPDNLSNAQSETRNSQPFTVIMPPPNANGSLHIGHAVFVTLQDIMVRFARMRGRKTLWLPGADHAGFETQVVYDKKLDKEGRNRWDIPREDLWKEIWGFTQANKKVMENQLRKLGASCDWSREKFTLDPDIVGVVYDTFKKLYDDGLIYRDLKVVNWCPKHHTALSDLEVKYVERTDPLYYITYGPLTLATVRPETKFGDTALAVNPKDKRYKLYVGKTITAKGILGPLDFKVIADDAVDPKFGTGVVKITPAHDAADFEMWQRHKREIGGPVMVIDENGRLTDRAGEYRGLKVAEAREKVAGKMKEIGILEKVDPSYVHQVATCYKCNSTLEPLPRPQWFVKTKPLADRAAKAIEKNEITFHPARSKKVALYWLKNIRDWNISRQITWGIRIPAWFCLGCGKPEFDARVRSRWFIIRHGETNWNKEGRMTGQRQEVPLNETGREQVRRAAQTLKNKGVELIVSSDMVRCRETAEIIAEALGVEVVYDAALRERSHGSIDGMTRDEAIAKYGRHLYNYDDRLADEETYQETETRVWKAFIEHRERHEKKNVVIVSHGGAIRMLVKRIKNLTPDEAMTRPSVKNAETISLDVSSTPCTKCGGDLYEQDTDVFDTWFSSGQWPFATLMTSGSVSSKSKAQSSKASRDFETFYPTDVMETGYDILFFWVTRMIMLGLYRTGKVPFRTVYLHGLVRDKDRQKMSKSKGNVIDPLGVAETYGTDALRMALVVGNTPGNDIIISEDKIRGYRNFVTKIWNIARFILINKPRATTQGPGAKKPKLTARDKIHLVELAKTKKTVTRHIERFEFHLAAEKLYHYIWHTFADKIIEEYKSDLRQEGEASAFGAAPRPSGHGVPTAVGTSERVAPARTLAGGSSDSQKQKLLRQQAAYHVLEHILLECLKMLHPFMPFITETIWGKFRPDTMLMIEKW